MQEAVKILEKKIAKLEGERTAALREIGELKALQQRNEVSIPEIAAAEEATVEANEIGRDALNDIVNAPRRRRGSRE